MQQPDDDLQGIAMIMTSEQETIAQAHRWADLANEHKRAVYECNAMADATLQGYATMRAFTVGVKVAAVYREQDGALWQVTGVYAGIDSDVTGVERIDTFAELRPVEVDKFLQGVAPYVGTTVIALDKWHEAGLTPTELVCPLEDADQ